MVQITTYSGQELSLVYTAHLGLLAVKIGLWHTQKKPSDHHKAVVWFCCIGVGTGCPCSSSSRASICVEKRM